MYLSQFLGQYSMLLLLTFFFFDPAHAQQRFERPLRSLPQVAISTGVSLHIVSPEPIQKVDVSSQAISGDLLEKNVLRLKVIPDSAYLLLRQASSTVVVSIIGESYIAQYNLCFVPAGLGEVPALINIQPEHCQSLDVAGIGLSTLIMKSKALEMLAKQSSQPIRKAKAYGLEARLNQVYTLGDCIFLDIGYINRTNIPYSIDELRFKIEDRKINKATNVQAVEIKPVWKLYPGMAFKRRYRNIFVLRKMTFPENKVLNIELSEKQISGRTIVLKVRYGNVLKADTI